MMFLPFMPGLFAQCYPMALPGCLQPQAEAGASVQPIQFADFCGTQAEGPDQPFFACQGELAAAPAYACVMTFRILVHNIRRGDGSGGFSSQEIESLLSSMYADFAKYGIYFDELGVEAIDNSFIYDNLQLGLIGYLDQNFGAAGRIDIFLCKKGERVAGAAAGIPSLSFLARGPDLKHFKVLTHEMGHCLGLHHTWRGFEKRCPPYNPACVSNPPDPNSCEESPGWPPASTACGDCVADTPPDPWQWILPASSWGECSPLVYCDYYVFVDKDCAIIRSPPGYEDIDVGNIMSYYRGYYVVESDTVPVECRQHFTPGQIERIRKVLLYDEFEQGGDPSNGTPDYSFLQHALADKIVIRSNTVWDEPVEVCVDVYVRAPARLDIFSEAHIHPGVKFVVEPGALLRIDGGVMTSAGSGYWKGIEVWGDAAAPLVPFTGQGRLIVRGDALIENADQAIVVFNPSPESGGIEATAGGFVWAEDSRFLNNGRAVEIRKYGLPEYSRFINCVFAMDDSFAGPALYEEHVKLEGGRGVSFVNCVFQNTAASPSLEKSIGIHSLDSRFSVRGSESRFEGVRWGVKAGNVASARAFSIKDATFSKVELGILALGANHFTITGCAFELGGYPGLPSASQEGIQIERSTGFSVRGNTFLGTAPGLSGTAGIKVIDTGLGNDANTLYGNEFDALYVGNAAIGDNMGGLEGGGIIYECNRNLGQNAFDFWVQEGGGIIDRQRSPDGRAAGNTFSQNGSGSVSASDFDNQGGFIEYHYRDMALEEEPLYYTSATIEKIVAEKNDCQNGLVGGEVPQGEIPALKAQFAAAQGSYRHLLAQYSVMLDGGDTPGLEGAIAAAGPGQATALKNALLALSPFVSQQALKAMIGRPEIFSMAMQVEVLCANPEAVRRRGFPKYLEQHASLSPAELGAVWAASTQKTYRDTLEAAIAAAYTGIHRDADLVLAHYLLDTASYEADSILAWLGNKGSLHSAYLKAGMLLELGRAQAALDSLDAIPSAYLLTEAQQAAFANKRGLAELAAEASAGLQALDSLQQQRLALIAAGPGLAGVQAQHWLSFAYGAPHQPNWELPAPPAPEHRALEAPPAFAPQIAASCITAFPNPARGSVVFRYSLPGQAEALIRLYDWHGRPAAHIPAPADAKYVEHDVSALPSGLYAYQLLADGRLLASGKILILD